MYSSIHYLRVMLVIGGSKGAPQSNFFHFHVVFGMNLAQTKGLPSHLGNPAFDHYLLTS